MRAFRSVFLFLFAIPFSSFGSTHNMKKPATITPTIIAHRGASYLAPEETSKAYLLALKLPHVSYLEMDVQRTKDGELVLIHDDNLKRTIQFQSYVGEPAADTAIGNILWNELSQGDAGSWFNQTFPARANADFVGLPVLRLMDLINILDKNAGLSKDKGLYLELKSPELYPGIEKEVIAVLRNSNWLSKTVFQSFNYDSLLRVKEIEPQAKLAYLVDLPPVEQKVADYLTTLIESSKKDGIKTLAIRGDLFGAKIWQLPSAIFQWRKWIHKIHKEGLKVHIWTLNSSLQVKLFKKLGADGIFTDHAHEVQNWIKL